MIDFLKQNPARVFALAVAIVTLLVAYGIDLPQEAWLGLVAAVLALFGGEVVQRKENAKTEAALWTDPLEAGADAGVGEHEAPEIDPSLIP